MLKCRACQVSRERKNTKATKMAHFFTIICEHKGGTYTEQLRAEHPAHAFKLWAEKFKNEEVLTKAEQKKFIHEVQYSLDNGNLVAMEGIQNVWYEGFSLEDDLLEVLIVGMSEQPIKMMQGAKVARMGGL